MDINVKSERTKLFTKYFSNYTMQHNFLTVSLQKVVRFIDIKYIVYSYKWTLDYCRAVGNEEELETIENLLCHCHSMFRRRLPHFRKDNDIMSECPLISR